MRIPSQFNDETLYGRQGKRPSSGASYRRLIRLAVALALVVVVMQQASQPGMYETFFGDSDRMEDFDEADFPSGLRPDPSITPEQSILPQQSGQAVFGDAASDQQGVVKTDAETRAAANAIAQAMSPQQQRQWIVILDRWQSGAAFDLVGSVVAETVDVLDNVVLSDVDDLNDQQQADWTSTLNAFGQRFANAELFASAEVEVVASTEKTVAAGGVASKNRDEKPASRVSSGSIQTDDGSFDDDDLAREHSQRLTAWLAALDQAAVDRVVDGAIWRSDDFDAFYRQLDQAPRLNVRGATKVSVIPLMQQPQVYLGKRVRVSGHVARSERKLAAANPFGVQQYWELWIRPSDGGDRPMVLMVPEVTKAIEAVGIQTVGAKGPEVRVVGRFFKRLAYGSTMGADAAPVIVGRLLIRKPQFSTANAAPGHPAPAMRFSTVVGIAVLLGVGFATMLMWRTSVLNKQSREVRSAGRNVPEKFLQQLADHDGSDQSNQ